MNYGVLFSLLISHVVADFILQSSVTIEQRFSADWKEKIIGNLKHSATHSVVSVFLLSYYIWTSKLFFTPLLLFISHFIIDVAKGWILSKWPFLKYSILVFFIDQMLHVISMLAIGYYVSKNLGSPLNLIKLWEMIVDSYTSSVTFNQKLLLCFLLLLIGLWGVGVFIRILVNKNKFTPYKNAINLKIEIAKDANNNGVPDGGFLIGILERLIIIFAVSTNIISIVGFLITVKSIARFKKFDDDSFVEYFIIGSFISVISAMFIGFIIRQLNIIPLLN